MAKGYMDQFILFSRALLNQKVKYSPINTINAPQFLMFKSNVTTAHKQF